MNNLIQIKQIVDHVTKEPLYPKTHAIGVGYTDKDGECITVLEALDNLDNLFETLHDYDLTLGYGADQAFPGNKGKELMDAVEDLQNDYHDIEDNIEDLEEGLSTKLDVLVSGENIKTINKESLLIDENTPENKKNFSLSNSDEYAKIDEETLEEYIKYKALAQGEELMLVLKSMGPEFDVLDLPSEYDPDKPYTTNFNQYDLDDDGKINYTELGMLYTFKGVRGREATPSVVPLTDFPNEIYDAGNGVRYTYKREKITEGNTTRYKLVLGKSENEGPWETVDNKTLDMSAYLVEKDHTAGPEEDGEITSSDISAWYIITKDISEKNNILYGGGDFEGEDTLFAIYDPSAPQAKRIKIGYNFTEYIKNKNSEYILFECTPSKNVIYCNSFTGKLYRWSTNPDSTMIELLADSYSRSAIKNLSNYVNTLSDLVDTLSDLVDTLSDLTDSLINLTSTLSDLVNTLSNTKLDTLTSGVNIKTINGKSILLSPSDNLTNFSLSNSDDVVVENVSLGGLKKYKALAQGEEQMLVLKSMGDLDIVPITSDYEQFDLNDDGTINYEEIKMMWGFLGTGNFVRGITEPIWLNSWNSDIYYINVNNEEESDDSTLSEESETLLIWYVIRKENGDTNFTLWKSIDKGVNWEKQADKNPNIILKASFYPNLVGSTDASDDQAITASDVTGLYTILLYFTGIHTGYSSDYEFKGRKTFAIFDPVKEKIIIGYDFDNYTRAPDVAPDSSSFSKLDYIITEFDPSTNVIYCNSFNNKLYRWQQYDSDKYRMIEINKSVSELISDVNNLQTYIHTMQNHIEALETYVESQGGDVYHDEPGDPRI